MSGILARFFEQRAALQPGFHVSQTPPAHVDRWAGGTESTAGIQVTPDTAMQSTAVFGCVRILAETVACLPLIVYRRLERGKERATDHPLYSILHDLPNPEMTSQDLRETIVGHTALRGNAYAEIERDNGGRVIGLWPLHPDKMIDIRRDNGRIKYVYRLPDKFGETAVLDMDKVFHLRTFGYTGLYGYSVIRNAANAVGLALATEAYGSQFFANGARPGGVLEHPTKLSDPAYDRLKTSWENRHKGLDSAHRVAILEEGLKYHEIGIKPEEAQFLETRKFQVTDIARMFRVPPHMLADLDRATFSNIEHLSIEFVTFSLLPWFVRWEQQISRSLLTPAERKTYFAQHLVAGLLRGDMKSRYEAYHIARLDGWMSGNDIRELEDMNPRENLDVYWAAANFMPAEQFGRVPVQPTQTRAQPEQRAAPAARENTATETPEARGKRAAGKRRKLVGVYRSLYIQTAERVLRREARDVKEAARKYLERRSVDQFRAWLSEYYDDHEEFISTAFGPVNQAYGLVVGEEAQAEIGSSLDLVETLAPFLATYLVTYAKNHAGGSILQVHNALQRAIEKEADPVDAIDELVQHWIDARAAQIADEETVRLNNSAAREIYRFAGVTKVQWVSFGENCPYCTDLNGKVIGIDDAFIPANTDWQPEGAEGPLRTKRNIFQPPSHIGCDCSLAAA